MFCKNCGSELQEGMKFCNNCGTPVETPEPVEEEGTVSMFGAAAPQAEPAFAEPEQPVYVQPEQPAYTQPIYTTPEPQPAYTQPQAAAGFLGTIPPSQVLTWGILGLAFAAATGLLGIIFSIIGKKKAAAYTAAGNPLTGTAKVGSILSKVGLGVGIGMTVFWTLYIVIMAAIAVAAAESGLRY